MGSCPPLRRPCNTLRRFASKKIFQHLENIASEKFQEHFWEDLDCLQQTCIRYKIIEWNCTSNLSVYKKMFLCRTGLFEYVHCPMQLGKNIFRETSLMHNSSIWQSVVLVDSSCLCFSFSISDFTTWVDCFSDISVFQFNDNLKADNKDNDSTRQANKLSFV